MNKPIRNYEELLHEEQRLKAQLSSYQVLIKEDLTAIREGLNPVKRGIALAKRLLTRDDNGPLLNFGLNFSIDMLIRKLLLARAGWLFKVVVPYVVKNYASHIVSEDDREKITKSIRKWFKKVLRKKDEAVFETEVS